MQLSQTSREIDVIFPIYIHFSLGSSDIITHGSLFSFLSVGSQNGDRYITSNFNK